MARPLRIAYPGALYHLTNRGNAQSVIYQDDQDRSRFLTILAEVVVRYQWLCHAYCLMDNHYHLLVETPEGNLSQGMQQLNSLYTQTFNRRHHRVGHLFQGRYKALLIERQSYLLELCRYVVLNPVRAGMVSEASAYCWSSLRATIGLEGTPAFLTTDWILSQFGMDHSRAQEAYSQFVMAGIGQSSPWSAVKAQVMLGSESFLATMRRHLDQTREQREVPRTQRFLDRPPLQRLFQGKETWTRTLRNAYIYRAHREYGYSLTEIGGALGLHYSTISKIVKQHR